MEKYKCDICNKKHSLLNVSESPLPDEVSNAQLEEGRVEQLTENAFLIDKLKLIISGDIQIQISNLDYDISHRVWVRIDSEIFQSKIHHLDKGKPIIMDCEIISDLPFFERTKGLNADYILLGSTFGEIKVKTDSQIKQDQLRPIKTERFIEMMKRMYHPELWNYKSKFDIPFKDRFENTIQRAKSEFESLGKRFIIDINNQREILFQLASSDMTSIESQGEIGLHLSNDSVNDNYDIVKKKMSLLCDKFKISKLLLDEVETYQKNYNFDSKNLLVEIKQIIRRVFEENIEELEIIITEL